MRVPWRRWQKTLTLSLSRSTGRGDESLSAMSLPLDDPGSERATDPRWLSVTCLMAAAVCVAIAINERDGEYYPKSLALVTVAIALCALGTLAPRVRDPGVGHSLMRLAALAAVVAQALVVLRSTPSGWFFWSNDLDPSASPRIYYGVVGAACVLAAIVALSMYTGWRVVARVAVPVAMLLHLVVGTWMIRASPSPRIDVHLFQQEAAKTLLHGDNPYATTFDDMYRSTAPGERPVYGEGLVRDGKVIFGFPYPPVSLYLSTLGYAAAGDHRYAQLLAITLSAALLAYGKPGAWSALMAVLFLFAPRSMFVLGRGWTEPFVVLFLAATVFCALRLRKLLPIALGLLLASKQYMVLAVPLVPLLLEGPFRWKSYLSLLAKAGGVALLVTLPFALWDWQAFWHSLVTVQKVAPFREDALSYLVWFYHQTGTQLGVAPAFAAATIAIGLALWRAERSAAGFAASVALVYLVFIALNKQAFANYYFFVIGALWCAAGSLQRPYGMGLNSEPSNVR